jgi:U3 small nucleolar RNA-associated protein MPP10
MIFYSKTHDNSMIAVRMEATSIRHIADLLASLSPTQAPQTRSQAKRKRSPSPTPAVPVLESTPILSLHIDGMDEEQVWAQLELKNKSLCETLQYALDATGEDTELLEGEEGAPNRDASEEDDSDEDDEGSDEDDLDDSDDSDDPDSESEESEDEDLGEGIISLRDPEDDEAEDEEPPTLFSHIQSALAKAEKPRRRSGKQSEVDDDFFNLAEFNAETERAEAKKVSRGSLAEDDEDEVEDIDLFGTVDDVQDEDDEGSFYSLNMTQTRFLNQIQSRPIKISSRRRHRRSSLGIKRSYRRRGNLAE